MKDKDGMEDFIAQLSKSPPEKAILEIFDKFARLPVHHCTARTYGRIFRAILPFSSSESRPEEVSKAALLCGLRLIESDTTGSLSSAGGATFSFFETCCKILLNEIKKDSGSVVKIGICLRVLCAASISTLLKLFSNKSGGSDFVDIVCSCLKFQELQNFALQLSHHGLSSEPFGKIISEKTAELMEIIYPFLFDANKFVRKAALAALQKMDLKIRPASWKKMKQTTVDEYCLKMVAMVKNIEKDWPDIWCFIVNLFGEDLHSGSQLINKMLEVIECGYKHQDLDWSRVQAFHCWKTLIDNFKSGFSSKKRMDLILIPLRAANHRTEALTSAKLSTYAHLLNTIANMPCKEPEVVMNFVSFCFGSGSKADTYRPVKAYPALREDCSKAFELVLTCCKDLKFFGQVHKPVIRGTADCILLNVMDIAYVSKLWTALLGVIKLCEGLPQYKEYVTILLDVSKWLMQQSSDRSELAALMASPLLYNLVIGDVSLKHSVLTNSMPNTRSSDFMQETPALQMVEWLLEYCVLCGVTQNSQYLDLVSEIMEIGGQGPAGFLTFIQSTLRKMSRTAEKAMIFMGEQSSSSVISILTHVWSRLVEQVVTFILNGGEINQGDAAQHDFHCVYAVLLYPVEHLYTQSESIEECSTWWCQAFKEFSKQAALVATSESHEFCEQTCNKLVAFVSPTTPPKQMTAVYLLLTYVIKVESGDGLKPSKKWSHVQNFITDLLLKLVQFGLGKEETFIEAATCLCSCLKPPTSSYQVLDKLSKVLRHLLILKFITYEPVNRVYEVLKCFKDNVVYLRVHSKESLKSQKSFLEPLLLAGQTHASQKLRRATQELKDAIEGRKVINDDHSQHSSSVNRSVGSCGSVLHYSSASSPVKQSPITSNSSKGESPSKKSPKAPHNKMLLPAPTSEFVRIDTPPKKLILTEHQKEVMKERRQDIPALYQDLTQDTQSMSQDSSQEPLAVPLTFVNNSKGTLDVEEHAVMDVSDVDPPVQVLTSEKKTTAAAPEKKSPVSEIKKNSLKSFTPPSGFLLPPSAGSASKSRDIPVNGGRLLENSSSNDSHPVKAKQDNPSSASPVNLKTKAESPHRRKASVPVKKHPTVKRNSPITQKMTRSGRIIKRLSLVDHSKETQRKLRKSLPAALAGNDMNIKPIADENSGASSKDVSKKNKSKGEEDKLRIMNCSLNSDNPAGSPGACLASDISNCVVEKSPEHTQSKESLTKNKPQGDVDHPPSTLKCSVGGKSLKRSLSNSSLNHVIPTFDSNVKSKKHILSTEVTDSMDVIESSQEPVGQITKKCAVSLEQFDEPEPNGKVELANVVLVKGPDAASPFKVLNSAQQCGDIGSVARRVLSIDGLQEHPSPSTFMCLKVSESGTPLSNGIDGHLSFPQGTNALLEKAPPIVNAIQNSENGVACSLLPATSCDESPVKGPPQKLARRLNMDSGEDGSNSPTNIDGVAVVSRNDSLPDWMHEKKTSPVGKGLRGSLRRASIRSQAFLKTSTDSEASISPIKGTDESRTVSPVPSKKGSKLPVDSNINASPIVKRPGRAAQLVGLGQAAAARGGDRVVPGTPLSMRAERSEDRETVPVVNTTPTVNNLANGLASSTSSIISVQDSALASPSIRRRVKQLLKSDAESPKSSPSKSLKDEGVHEDWIPKNPLTTTPSGILKRKRDADCELHSPSTKRKRVSFRDPPLSTLLSFNEDCDKHGTVFSAPRRDGGMECGRDSSKYNQSTCKDNCIEVDLEHVANGEDTYSSKKARKDSWRESNKSHSVERSFQMEAVDNPDAEGASASIHSAHQLQDNAHNKILSNSDSVSTGASKLSPTRELETSESSPKTNARQEKAVPTVKVVSESLRRSVRNSESLNNSDSTKDQVPIRDALSPTKDSSPSKERDEEPKSSLKKGEEPKSSPKKGEERKSSPKKGEEPKRSPKKGEESKTSPKKGEEPKTSPKKGEEPKTSPKKGEEPKTSPKKGEEPKTSPKKGEEPKTSPKKGEEPKSSPKEVEEPKSSAKRGEEPKSSPKKVEEPKSSPKKVEEPKSSSKKGEEPKSSPKKGEEPKNSPKKGDSPYKDNSLRKKKDETHEEGRRSPRRNSSPTLLPPLRSPSQIGKHKDKVQQEYSSEEEDETQGMLEDLVQMVNSPLPVFPNLLKCEHPIDKLVSDLTSSTWCKSLLHDFIKRDIKTVGSLAALSEEKINRLQIKSPKVETVTRALKKFEREHDQKPYYIATCGLSNMTSSPSKKKKLKALLSEYSVEDIIEVVSKDCKDSVLCENVSSSSLLQILTERLTDVGVIDELKKRNEKIIETVVCRAKPDVILDMMKAEDIGSTISCRKAVLNSIKPDAIAETYIHQIHNTNGKHEFQMSSEQLSQLLGKTNPATLRELVCPSDCKESLIGLDVLVNFLLKGDTVKLLSPNCFDAIKNSVLNMTDVNDLSKHVLQGINNGTVSSDNLDLLIQGISSKLNEKRLLRLLCEAGLKLV